MAWPRDAQAYAWMIRHGYTKCDTCHTDPSGGETLNHMGRVQSETLLSTDWGGHDTVTSDAKLLYSLDEPDHWRGGGAVRVMSLYTLKNKEAPSEFRWFPMQMDLYGGADYGFLKFGGSFGLGKIRQGSQYMRAAQVTRTDEGYALLSRSHWVGFDLGNNWLVRLGRLNLPFGVRTSEHTLLVRQSTHTDRESDQQHGAAISYSGGRFRGEGMFVAGNFQIAPDDYRKRGFTGYLEYLLEPNLAVGIDTLILTSGKDADEGRTQRTINHAHGVTARYSPMTQLAVLGELDVLKISGRKLGYAGFATGDYELKQGLHLAATAEVANNGRKEDAEPAPGAGEMTYNLWLTCQWFALTHLDFRADAVLSKGGGKVIEAQAHMYF
jgi:hypothetical protein